MSEGFGVGDRVELVAVPPGFVHLRVGQPREPEARPMSAKLARMSECFRIGDPVELVAAVPGRPRLRPGLQGAVLVGDEAGTEWGMLTVRFPQLGPRPWQLRRQHLRRRVAPPAVIEDGAS